MHSPQVYFYYYVMIPKTKYSLMICLLIDEYDLDLLKQYSEKFLDTGLSKIVQGYFKYLQKESVEALDLYTVYIISLY